MLSIFFGNSEFMALCRYCWHWRYYCYYSLLLLLFISIIIIHYYAIRQHRIYAQKAQCKHIHTH